MAVQNFLQGYRVIGALAKERITLSEFHALLQDSGRLESYERVFKNKNRQEIVLQKSSALDAIAGNLGAYAHAPESIRRVIQTDETHFANLLASVLGDDPETFDLDDVANYAGNQVAVELIVQSDMLMNRIGASYAATEALLGDPVGIAEVLNSEIAAMAISTNVGIEYVVDTPTVLSVWPEAYLSEALAVVAHKGLFFKALLGSSDATWDNLETFEDIIADAAKLELLFTSSTSKKFLMELGAIDFILNSSNAIQIVQNNVILGVLRSNAITVPTDGSAQPPLAFGAPGYNSVWTPFSAFRRNIGNTSNGHGFHYIAATASGDVGYNFQKEVWLFEVSFRYLSDSSTNRMPETLFIECSDNGNSGWQIVGTFQRGEHYPSTSADTKLKIQTSFGKKQYWRLRGIKQAGAQYLQFDDIQFYCV